MRTRLSIHYWLAGLLISGLVVGLAAWRWGECPGGREESSPLPPVTKGEKPATSSASSEEVGWPLSIFFEQLAREKPIELQPDALPDSEEGQRELYRARLRRDQGADARALFEQIAEKYQGQKPGWLALLARTGVHPYDRARLEWVDERVAVQLRLAETYPTAPTAPRMFASTVRDLVIAHQEVTRQETLPDGSVRDETRFLDPSPEHWHALLGSLGKLLGRYPESPYCREALQTIGRFLAGRPETTEATQRLVEWAQTRYPEDRDFGVRMETIAGAALATAGNPTEAVQRLHTAFLATAGEVKNDTTGYLRWQLDEILCSHPELRPTKPRPVGRILLRRPEFERARGFVLLDESPQTRKMGWRPYPWETLESRGAFGEPGEPEKRGVYPLPCGVRGAAAWYIPQEGQSPEVALDIQGRPVCPNPVSLLLTPSFPVHEGDTLFNSGNLWFRQTARRVGDTVEVTLRANGDFVGRQVWHRREWWWREATWEFQAAVSVGFIASMPNPYDSPEGRTRTSKKTYRLKARRLPDEPPPTIHPSPTEVFAGLNAIGLRGLEDSLLDLLGQCARNLLAPVDLPGYLEKVDAVRRTRAYHYRLSSPRKPPFTPEDLGKLARQELDPNSDEGIRTNALLAQASLKAGRFAEAAERYRLLDAARGRNETTDGEVRSILDRPFEGPWAQALAALGRREEVAQLLQRTQQKRTLRTSEGLLLADTLFELEDYPSAATAYASLPVTGNALGARRLLREGLAWAQAGDPLRAQRAWRECVRFFPDSPEAEEARQRAEAQAEVDSRLAARGEEKPWEDFGLRAQWSYTASDLPEGGRINAQLVLDHEEGPEILIQTHDRSQGSSCFVVDPMGRTLQPADRERFQAAVEAARWPHRQSLRKREIHRNENFVLWQEAETLTMTAPDGAVKWRYTVENEVEEEASPGIPLLAGITVTYVAGKPVLVFGVQQRTVSVGMALIYYPVSGDLRCLELEGTERWRRPCSPCEKVLVVAPPQAEKPVAYVLGVIPEKPGRGSRKATRVLECFDLASGRSQRRIDLPPAFTEGSYWREVKVLEARDFSPEEPGHELLVKAGQAMGVYSPRGRPLYEKTEPPVLYAAPARLRGEADQVVCVWGEEYESKTPLAVLGPNGRIRWKWNGSWFSRYDIESHIRVADVDGDGFEEIIVFDSETVSVLGFRG